MLVQFIGVIDELAPNNKFLSHSDWSVPTQHLIGPLCQKHQNEDRVTCRVFHQILNERYLGLLVAMLECSHALHTVDQKMRSMGKEDGEGVLTRPSKHDSISDNHFCAPVSGHWHILPTNNDIHTKRRLFG